MQRSISLILFLLALISCQEKNISTADTNLYPEQLNFGQHNIGFKTLWKYDITRAALPYSDWDGKLYGTEEIKGRQFQINIWYPTEDGNDKGRLSVRDYMDLSYRQINFKETVAGKLFGQKELISKFKALGGTDSLDLKDLEKLEELGCIASEGARPSEAEYPVILFPNGMAPLANSTTAEFLASHGFVVVAFVIKGQSASTIDNSSKGAIVASDDLEYVLSQILELPNVNDEKIGLMGNAIESSFCIAYLSKNRNIAAYVSLEGGFISKFEQDILKGLPHYEPPSIDLPMLIVYSPHPSIDPMHIEHLVYSKRYFAHLPGMREFDYLNFGLFNSTVPNIIGEPRGNVEQGFIRAHELIKDYFNATLKDSSEGFDKKFLAYKGGEIDTTFIWDKIPRLPSIAEIKNGYIVNGLAYLDSIYSHQKRYTNTPFTPSFINDFTDWVAWKKDPEYVTRKWLYEKTVDDYPASAWYTYSLAYYALKAGDTTMAREQYTKVLEQLTTDIDPILTPATRARITERANDLLGEMQ